MGAPMSLDDKLIRFLVLHRRQATLDMMVDHAEKEAKDNVSLLFAEAFDKDVAKKLAGDLIMLKEWRDECKSEYDKLADEVNAEINANTAQSVLENLLKDDDSSGGENSE